MDATLECSYRSTRKQCTKFTCNEGGTVYFGETILKNHAQGVHTTNEPLPCEVCGLALADFNPMRQHVNKLHKMEGMNCRCCDYAVKDVEESGGTLSRRGWS